MSEKQEKLEKEKLERRRWGKRPTYPFVDSNGVLVTSNRRRSLEIRDEDELQESVSESTNNTNDILAENNIPADELSLDSLPHDDESAEFFVDDLNAAAVGAADSKVLELHFKKWALKLNPEDGNCSVGRDDSCDLVMPNRFASRRHGRIEWRDGAYYFCDHSFNGTYIEFDNGKKTHICRDEVRLESSGKISLGKPANVEKDFMIEFKNL